MIRRKFKRMIKFLHALLGILLICVSLNCGKEAIKSNTQIVKKIDPVISDFFTKFDLPGLAVGVVFDNKTVYAKGFGLENVETGIPVKPTTIFHMASDSKPFVATSIMQLREQGKIDLDAPVVTYLPYFRLDDERYREITVQQMLKHSSGLPNENDFEFNNPQFDAGALERYVRSLGDKKLLFEPDEKFRYSNIAYEVLGDVIAKVSGLSFEDYVNEHIFDHTGMQYSTFYIPSNMRSVALMKSKYLPKGWASPHLRTLKLYVWHGYPYNRRHAPSTTLHSNVLDMCNWAITNMNKGMFEKDRILQPSSYDLLWQPYFDNGWRTWKGYCGLSWFIGEYKGEKMIFHGGSDAGFISSFVLLPDKKIAVILLCNDQTAPLRAINDAILDVLLGYEPKSPRPGAFIPVGRTLAEKGLEAAAEHWNRLKEKTQSGSVKYDFGERQIGWAIIGMPGQHVEEAVLLAKFCKHVLPGFTKTAIDLVKRFKGDTPAAQAMLKVLREK